MVWSKTLLFLLIIFYKEYEQYALAYLFINNLTGIIWSTIVCFFQSHLTMVWSKRVMFGFFLLIPNLTNLTGRVW